MPRSTMGNMSNMVGRQSVNVGHISGMSGIQALTQRQG